MSENEEIMNETENETMAAEVEAVETVETEAAEVEAADEVSAEEEAEVVEAAVDYDDEELMDKMQKAARLLRSRRFAISKEEEAKAERMANIERAIKLLDLKPKMEQKEMSDLLGMRLRELDGLMAEAEAADLVGRIDDAEGDMRKIVVFAAEDAAEGLVELANKKEKLLPELSYEEATELMAALDKVIAPLVAMGLDEDRGPRGGRDERGGRGGDRGGRQKPKIRCRMDCRPSTVHAYHHRRRPMWRWYLSKARHATRIPPKILRTAATAICRLHCSTARIRRKKRVR